MKQRKGKNMLDLSSSEERKNVLDLSSSEALSFFIKHESYCNLDLPPYILFDSILKKVNSLLTNQKLEQYLVPGSQNSGPQNIDKINHRILHNKDGRFAWRPFQLIHPALYTSLVREVTEEKNWNLICNRFKEFKKNSHIKCMSIPVTSSQKKADKPTKISYWWKDVEQQSIKMSLKYEYLTHIDISNCYGSIYTHSIPWAIYGKNNAKENRREQDLIGNVIDKHLRDISYGQTNGIPQGSVLTDFIAEIVLGYIDCELTKKIEQEEITHEQYDIIRYKDDYRIFTNNLSDGEKIVKIISEILVDFGMTLNPNKTKPNDQVIIGSVKSDKLYWLRQKHSIDDPQNHLLLIHQLSMRFPNSGRLMIALGEFYDKLPGYKQNTKKQKDKKQSIHIENVYQLISIIVDIAYRNPRTYPVSAAILSHLISCIDDTTEQKAIVEQIVKKFKTIPNTGYLDIWLQRVVIGFDGNIPFKEPICKIVTNTNNRSIWNSNWLKNSFKKNISDKDIVDKVELKKLTGKPIERKEFAIFPKGYY